MTQALLRIARRLTASATLGAATMFAPLAAPLSAQQTTLNVPDGIDPSAFFLSGPFGKSSANFPASLAVGQTFIAPLGYGFLQSFSFWLGNDPGFTVNAPDLKFRAYLAKWDGSKATDIAYTSEIMSGPVSVSQQYTFSTPNFAVDGSQQYVAFLSSVGLDGSIVPSEASAAISTSFDGAFTYAGGGFVYASGASLDDLTGAAWENSGSPEYQTQFSAVFTTQTVPEPSSQLLLATGALVLLIMVRRMKRRR